MNDADSLCWLQWIELSHWLSTGKSTDQLTMLRARVSADRKADFNISADRVRHMQCITKTRLFKYIENFTTKNENFQMKNSGNFHISAQNIDLGTCWNCIVETILTDTHYLFELVGTFLEPHRRILTIYASSRNKKINVYLCKSQYYCKKVEFKWVKTIQSCYRDGLQLIRLTSSKSASWWTPVNLNDFK